MPEFLGIIAGVLHALSLPGYNIEFLAWFAAALLFYALKNTGILRSVTTTFFYSVTFLSISHYWLISTLMSNFSRFLKYPPIYGFFTFLLFVLYQSLFFMGFGMFQSAFRNKMNPRTFDYLFLPWLYVFFEYLRSLGDLGFTGAMISDAFYKNRLMLLIFSVVGSYGVLYLVTVVGSLLAKKDIKFSIVLIGILTILFYTYNAASVPPVQNDGFKLKILQTAEDPMKRYSISFEKNVEKALKYKGDEILITPEAFVSTYPISVEMLKKLPEGIVFGTAYYNERRNVYNAVVYKEKNKMYIYKKVKLFPFAETMPYPKLFSFLSFLKKIHYYTPGEGYSPVEIQGKKVGFLICFETYFEAGTLEYKRKGADFLIVLTNDGWFKSGLALWQHFAKLVVRAAESGLWVVQSANAGITGVVDGYGRIVTFLKPNAESTVVVRIGKKRSTLYGCYYEFMPLIIVSFIVFSLFSVRRKRGLKVWR